MIDSNSSRISLDRFASSRTLAVSKSSRIIWSAPFVCPEVGLSCESSLQAGLAPLETSHVNIARIPLVLVQAGWPPLVLARFNSPWPDNLAKSHRSSGIGRRARPPGCRSIALDARSKHVQAVQSIRDLHLVLQPPSVCSAPADRYLQEDRSRAFDEEGNRFVIVSDDQRNMCEGRRHKALLKGC
jgi:hypothetical protein